MFKLMVFDLDNTLALLGKGITSTDVALLRALEQKGVRIAISSGKPVYYLCGFVRQVELVRPILIGENGAVIQMGVDLPPSEYHVLPYSNRAKRSCALIKKAITGLLPDMWYQPNEIALTPFPRNETEFALIEECLKRLGPRLEDVVIYRHVDSFDIIPEGIDKSTGLKKLGELLSIAPEETVAIGDGVNDYPMFDVAGHAVGINVSQSERVDMNFRTTTEALEYLITLL